MTHTSKSVAAGGRRRETPRNDALDLLTAIVKENPKADRAEHSRIFKETVLSEGYEDCLAGVIIVAFTLLYGDAYAAISPPTKDAIKTKLRDRKAAREVEDRLVKKAKSLIVSRLMSLVMPNGKPLKDCTGAECKRFGGIFVKIGEKIGPNAIVGRTLREADLQTLFK